MSNQPTQYRPPFRFWRTASGEILRIDKMDTGHLLNAADLLLRRADYLLKRAEHLREVAKKKRAEMAYGDLVAEEMLRHRSAAAFEWGQSIERTTLRIRNDKWNPRKRK